MIRTTLPAGFLVAGLLSTGAAGADVVLSEYNAVASDKWLGNPNLVECEGPAGFSCDDAEDTFFGRVIGNGGNWFELVVITDHLDMRGSRLFWEEVNTLEAGTIFLSNDAFWSDMRAGTVLTFTELTTAQGGLDTDTGFDPCRGDWWININSFDTTYVTTTETNVPGDGPGNFSVGNNDWRLSILDDAGTLVFGPAGEGAVDYSGTSVNSREILRLQLDPSAAVATSSPYDDGTRSSFGSPNNWTSALGRRVYQVFDPLRAAAEAACDTCAPMILNEYNAVGEAVFLNGGTAALDSDGLQAADDFFGRVAGNGGDWFELVVVQDDVDLRGWRLTWEETDTGVSGAIILSADALWSAVPSGTVLTFTEWTTAQGGLDTDVSYDPGAGDTWINVNTFDTTYVAGTTSTAPGHISGGFDVSDANWRLTIVDAGLDNVWGPGGEGAVQYFRDRVSERNVLRLEQNPSGSVTPLSAYDDGASVSTFGQANRWNECNDPVAVVQAFDGLPDPSCGGIACPADIDGSGVIGFGDLLAVLSGWGPCNGCPEDLDGNGDVGFTDLLVILSSWGPCP